MSFDQQIAEALDATLRPRTDVQMTGAGKLPSCFSVADLAFASVIAAAAEAGDLLRASSVAVDRRLAQLWFDMTLRPAGWDLPSLWDPIAGNYRTSDGWIRLHTNAPHHRDAVLLVLGCSAEKAQVAEVVSGWAATELDSAIVRAKGAAAAMRDMSPGAHNYVGEAIEAADQDYDLAVEHTGWGPAQRVRFPVKINDKGPDWQLPARPVRSDPAAWPAQAV